MIPRQVIEEILARTDISQLISKYVTLQRAGSNMKGLCPFHSEKTPSFTVYPSENSFYCYGCGVGGDSITFMRKAENLDYVEAIQQLANAAGITIPEQPDSYGFTPKYDKKRLLEMNRVAARYFYKCLYLDNPQAKGAYEYLHEKRGLSDATITHFGLGYAPNEYGEFGRYMTEQGFTQDELVIGNLCGRDEKNGRIYTSFYNRVMFPIIDVSGNVIAFGGRVMDQSTPKYKNSSDTPIYNKRRNVYGLNFAKNSCAEQLILCEGYMDVIAVQAAGFTNAVATLGTAITPEHARLMKRYTKRVVISYDMDEAGRTAADKAMRMLEEVGLEVRLLKMEGAKDPDEFIKKFGADKFRSILEGSSSKFDYNMDRILSKYTLTDPQDRINAASELCKLIASVYSAAERDVYIRVVAKRLDMEVTAIRQDVERLSRRSQTSQTKKDIQNVRQSSLGFSDKVNPDAAKMPAIVRCEEAVLGLLMLYPNYLQMVRDGKIDLSESDFMTSFNIRVFQTIMESDGNIISLAEYSPEETGRITKMKIDRMNLKDNTELVFYECVKNLKDIVNKKRQEEEPITPETLLRILQEKREQD